MEGMNERRLASIFLRLASSVYREKRRERKEKEKERNRKGRKGRKKRRKKERKIDERKKEKEEAKESEREIESRIYACQISRKSASQRRRIRKLRTIRKSKEE